MFTLIVKLEACNQLNFDFTSPCVFHTHTGLTQAMSKYIRLQTGGLKDHNFLATRVNQNIDYTFDILTSRAIDWYINESIMRGPGGGREGQGIFGRVSRLLLGHFYKV